MTHWYALKSRDELFTASMLREAGYPAYVPCETVERKVNRVKVKLQKPACRGYVFVNCPPTQKALDAVRSIGVSRGFVTNLDPVTGDLAPMRLAANALVPIILAEIFGDLDHTREPAPWEPARGDRVRLKKTLFNGYLGVITAVGKRKTLIDMGGWVLDVENGGFEFAA